MYDLERFGIVHMGNPRHSDVLIVTGTVNQRNQRVLRNVYDQMADPKVVVAIGACANSGGVFRDCYNVVGGADKVVPVDVYVNGCAVRPEAVIDGVVEALGKLNERHGQLGRNGTAATALVRSDATRAEVWRC
jgi:ech hydrogenase subunit C